MITHETSFGRTYHHNGDFSGEVRIVADPSEVEHGVNPDGEPWWIVKIPTNDLLDIVAEYIRHERISQIEDADSRTLLGLEVDAT